jgi:serine/threonine protein kinase
VVDQLSLTLCMERMRASSRRTEKRMASSCGVGHAHPLRSVRPEPASAVCGKSHWFPEASSLSPGDYVHCSGDPKYILGVGRFGNVIRVKAPRQKSLYGDVALKRIGKATLLAQFRRSSCCTLNDMWNEVTIHNSYVDKLKVRKEGFFLGANSQDSRCCLRINHPNVLRCYEVLEDPDSVSLVLELATLGDLARWLKANSSMRSCIAPAVVASVAGALVYLHEQSIAHRDLKPENILVFPASHEASLPTDLFKFRLGDFGCACMGDLNRTDVVGTPEFMAPELLHIDRTYNAAHADFWSFGILAYDLAHGMGPFDCSQSTDRNHCTRSVFAKIRDFQEPLEFHPATLVDVKTETAMRELCSHLLRYEPSERVLPTNVAQHIQHGSAGWNQMM